MPFVKGSHEYTHNLIPLTKVSPEVALERRQKGGSQCTPKKKLAAQVRELRKKGLNDEVLARWYEVLTDPDANDLYLFEKLNEILGEAKTATEKILAVRVLLELRKIRHGSKGYENKNITMDVQQKTYKFIIKDLTDKTIDVPQEVLKEAQKNGSGNFVDSDESSEESVQHSPR